MFYLPSHSEDSLSPLILSKYTSVREMYICLLFVSSHVFSMIFFSFYFPFSIIFLFFFFFFWFLFLLFHLFSSFLFYFIFFFFSLSLLFLFSFQLFFSFSVRPFWFGLVGFYGISTIVDTVYKYISNMSDLITYWNEPELIFLHTVKRFQVLLCNSNN